MLPFFADLVVRTDEARRAFETHPKVLEAVADGMPLARYRALMLELYSVVWHFNPVCAAAASRVADTHQQVRYHLYEHMHEEKFLEDFLTTESWLNDNIAVPGEVYREFVKYLYQKNLLTQNRMPVGKHIVNLKNITCPVLNLMAGKDDLVRNHSRSIQTGCTTPAIQTTIASGASHR